MYYIGLYFPVIHNYLTLYLIIYSYDYINNSIELLYSFFIIVFNSIYWRSKSILTLILINLGSIAIFISIKSFIFISLLISNIIDIYIFGLIIIFIHFITSYLLLGTVFISFLLFTFLTKYELFLYVLFFIEAFSSLFQSLTLSNRLSINLLAGSLLITNQ